MLKNDFPGILAYLQLNEVGPVKQIIFEPNQRLNIITGDNSFGKTLLLECAWWALAGIWTKYPASPRKDAAKDDVKIGFQLMAKSGEKGKIETISYDWDSLQWPKRVEETISPGLVIYARADGSFTVHDPVKAKIPPPGRDAKPFSPLIFDRGDIENGIIEKIPGQESRYLCNGLVSDWINWQRRPGSPFEVFKKILDKLSTASQEPLKPGEPVRVPGDARDMPSLIYPYGTVPFVHAAASVKRMIALAYLILWTWEEHKVTCLETKKNPYKSMVVLIDEVESHLHPQWQRSIIPSFLEIKKYLDQELDIQFLITTHSPLVMASSEPLFEDEKDKLFHLFVRDNRVTLEEQPFIRHGRVDNWFTSGTFGLFQARSLEAEKAIEAAKNLQQKENPGREEIEEVHKRLVRLLGDFDTFWPRWTYFAEENGVEV